MKVTKYEHATLLLSIGDDTLVIDPGMFSSAVDFGNVAAVVITHEHADHWTPEQLGRILDKNPDAVIYGPAGVKTAASGFDVTQVAAGDVVEAGPFTLKFFGEKHAVDTQTHRYGPPELQASDDHVVQRVLRLCLAHLRL